MRRLLAALLLGLPAAAVAGENAGVTAAPALQTPLGARAMGMGGAFTAVADDVYTLHYNPAGLANLSSYEATFMALTAGQDAGGQYLAGSAPLPFAGLSGSGYSTLAASALFSQSGQVQVNSLNPDGSPGPSSLVNADNDTVVTVGYAERIADTPFELPDSTRHLDHFVGVSGKFVRTTLAQAYTAQAYAADAGYFARCPELGLNLGASVLNIGGKMRFIDVGDPLPLTIRAGGAWSIPVPERHSLQWAADWEYQLYERLWYVNTGVEYTLFKQFAARLGYQAHRELGGFTLGFGAKWHGWALDYSWGMGGNLGDSSRFSVTYRFGNVPVREREKARRPVIESMPDPGAVKQMEKEQPASYDQPKTPRRQSTDNKGANGWIY